MLVISNDPMHNLFLGTAKNILKNIWLDNFSANNLQHIQKLVDSSEVPKSIGRIPHKNSF